MGDSGLTGLVDDSEIIAFPMLLPDKVGETTKRVDVPVDRVENREHRPKPDSHSYRKLACRIAVAVKGDVRRELVFYKNLKWRIEEVAGKHREKWFARKRGEDLHQGMATAYLVERTEEVPLLYVPFKPEDGLSVTEIVKLSAIARECGLPIENVIQLSIIAKRHGNSAGDLIRGKQTRPGEDYIDFNYQGVNYHFEIDALPHLTTRYMSIISGSLTNSTKSLLAALSQKSDPRITTVVEGNDVFVHCRECQPEVDLLGYRITSLFPGGSRIHYHAAGETARADSADHLLTNTTESGEPVTPKTSSCERRGIERIVL